MFIKSIEFVEYSGLTIDELNRAKKLIKLEKIKTSGGITCKDLPGQNILCLLQNW